MAASDRASDDSLYPIAVLIDELKNEDIQVRLCDDMGGGGGFGRVELMRDGCDTLHVYVCMWFVLYTD